MGEVFSRILEMSLYGSIAILAVLLFRLVFKKCPKKILILFWIVVAARLLCPVNFNSPTSVLNIGKLFPSKTETVVTENYEPGTTVQTASAGENVPAVTGDTVLAEEDALSPTANAGSVKENGTSHISFNSVASIIWIAVTGGLIIFSVIRYAIFYSKAKWSSRSYDGRYYMANDIDSPFVVGIFSPKIFFPFHMDDDEREYVLNHEWIHIKNKDSLIKLIGYFILCIHWFNPLVWLAFVMLCADIEMRVDEETTSNFDVSMIKEYCKSLVRHASDDKGGAFMQSTAFSGLGFGGMETKMRITNLLKKQETSLGFRIIALVSTIPVVILVSASSLDHKDQWFERKPDLTNGSANESQEESSVETTGDAAVTAALGDLSDDGYVRCYVDIINKFEAEEEELAIYTYSLYYVDSDPVPELVVKRLFSRQSNDASDVYLYSYKNGHVYTVLDNYCYEGYHNEFRNCYYYLPGADFICYVYIESETEKTYSAYTMEGLTNGNSPVLTGSIKDNDYILDGNSVKEYEFNRAFHTIDCDLIMGYYDAETIFQYLGVSGTSAGSGGDPVTTQGTETTATSETAKPTDNTEPAGTAAGKTFDDLEEGSILLFKETTAQSYKLVDDCGTAEIFCTGTWAKFVIDGKESDLFLSSDFMLSTAYMIRHSGRTFIYFSVINENWVHELNIFSVNNGVVSPVGVCQGIVFQDYYTQSTDVMAFLEDSEEPCEFGSFGRYYHMSDDGWPVLNNEDIYFIYLSMGAKVEYDMTGMVIRDGVLTGEEKTVYAGENVRPLCICRGAYIEFETSDGTVIRYSCFELFEHHGNKLNAIDVLFDPVYRG